MGEEAGKAGTWDWDGIEGYGMDAEPEGAVLEGLGWGSCLWAVVFPPWWWTCKWSWPYLL